MTAGARLGSAFATTRLLARRLELLARAGGRAVRNPSVFFGELDGYLRRRGAGPDSVVAPSADLPNVVPLSVELDASQPPRLNVLLPGLSLDAMSGGPNTAINLTYRLAAAGVPVRYVSTDAPKLSSDDELFEHFANVSGVGRRLENVELLGGRGSTEALRLGARDVFWATAWWTAQIAAGIVARQARRRFFYIIQEFEPGLYPFSAEYALALETYGMDVEPVVCTSLLAEYLTAQRVGRFADFDFASQALVFEAAVDRGRFFPEPRAPGTKRRLVFYGRPNAPRNLWPIGCAVLARAVSDGLLDADSWEIVSMGEPVPAVDLGRGVVMRSQPWLGYDAYAASLRRADVGLSLMLSPHTSYPPLELAACGVPVVTTTFGPKTPERLSALCPNIIGAEPALDALLRGLRDAIARAPEETRRAAAAMSCPRSWDDAFARLTPELLRRYEQLSST
jgi:O-antigen biosynthesis protein